MRSATVIILHAFVMHSLAKEVADTSVDDLASKFTDTLVDRLLGSLDHANLDDSTLAKPTHSGGHTKAVSLFARPSARASLPGTSYSISSLPGPPALKSAALKKIEANNRCFQVNSEAVAEAPPPVKAPAMAPALAKLKTDMTKGYVGPFRNGAGFDTQNWDKIATPAFVADMPGAVAPLLPYWDPLGIATNVPEGQLLYYREAELKHGRVCMLAVLGLLVGENFHPLWGGNVDMPSTFLGTPKILETPMGQFWPVVTVMAGLDEIRSGTYNANNPDRIPGDFGWDPLGLKPKKESDLKEIQNKELLNGRLAMIAAIGIMAQELVTGEKIKLR
jgi:hypothetical protein